MTNATVANPLPATAGAPIDWGEALSLHRRWLEVVVRSRLADFHAVEDVLQEVAMAALKQTNRPVEPSKVAPWLYRIALRKVINHRRHLGRQRRLVERFTLRMPEKVEGTVTESADHWLIRGESHSAVQEALKKLNPADRQILTLKYSEGWGYKELAEHMGVSIKTIEYRLLRARNMLRELL
jgi:RNA polymerase sigma-70 factor (ECF subfamily)